MKSCQFARSKHCIHCRWLPQAFQWHLLYTQTYILQFLSFDPLKAEENKQRTETRGAWEAFKERHRKNSSCMRSFGSTPIGVGKDWKAFVQFCCCRPRPVMGVLFSLPWVLRSCPSLWCWSIYKRCIMLWIHISLSLYNSTVHMEWLKLPLLQGWLHTEGKDICVVLHTLCICRRAENKLALCLKQETIISVTSWAIWTVAIFRLIANIIGGDIIGYFAAFMESNLKITV